MVAINLNVNVLDDLFEDLIVDIGEVLVELGEANAILILLQEPDNIGLCTFLDEMLILT